MKFIFVYSKKWTAKNPFLTPFLSKFHVWHHLVGVPFIVNEIMRIWSVWSTIWQVHEKWFILFGCFCISWLNNWIECRDVFRNVINSSFWNLVYVCVYLCECKSQDITVINLIRSVTKICHHKTLRVTQFCYSKILF